MAHASYGGQCCHLLRRLADVAGCRTQLLGVRWFHYMNNNWINISIGRCNHVESAVEHSCKQIHHLPTIKQDTRMSVRVTLNLQLQFILVWLDQEHHARNVHMEKGWCDNIEQLFGKTKTKLSDVVAFSFSNWMAANSTLNSNQLQVAAGLSWGAKALVTMASCSRVGRDASSSTSSTIWL